MSWPALFNRIRRDTYGRVNELKDQNVKTGGVAVLEDQDRFIYYMITKTSTYQKPTYANMYASLHAMKSHMVNDK